MSADDALLELHLCCLWSDYINIRDEAAKALLNGDKLKALGYGILAHKALQKYENAISEEMIRER